MAWSLKRPPSELPYWSVDLDSLGPVGLMCWDAHILAAGAEAERIARAPDEDLTVGQRYERKRNAMDTTSTDELDARIKRLKEEQHGKGQEPRDGGNPNSR